MVTQNDYALMVKKLSGELSESEEVAINNRINNDSEFGKAYQEVERVWNHAEPELFEVNTSAAWDKVRQQTLGAKRISLFGNNVFKIAAAVLVFAVLGVWLVNSFKQMPMSSVSTAANEIKQIQLPDGSIVWLHEFSTLSYENDLKGATRNVQLKGMAFFDVQRDEAHPFVIETPQGEVKVLGTSFEVSAYEKDNFERVTVSTGKVSFTSRKANVVLTKNQEASINASGEISQRDVNAEELIAWSAQTLQFKDETLDKVAEKIGRYFHVQVKLGNDKLKSCHFTGSFTAPKLKEVLDVIAEALTLKYTIEANRVFINGDGCKPPTN